MNPIQSISSRDLIRLSQDFADKQHRHPVVLVHAESDPTLPNSLRGEGHVVAVRYAATPLALRFHVGDLARRREEFTTGVVLTPLSTASIPVDVQEQLAQRVVMRLDVTSQLRGIFSATRHRRGVVDSNDDVPPLIAYLTRVQTNADGTQSTLPLRPAEAGLLTRQHVNREVVRSLLGAQHYPSQLYDIVKWSLRADAQTRWAEFTELPQNVQAAALSELGEQLGGRSRLALEALRKKGPGYLLEGGAIAEMLTCPNVDPDSRNQAKAVFRSTLVAPAVPEEELAMWADAATTSARQVGLGEMEVQQPLSRAERYVVSPQGFGDPELLLGSSVCSAGYDARATYFGEALEQERLRSGSTNIHQRFKLLLAHARATPANAERVVAQSAMRLLAFRQREQSPAPQQLAGWLAYYRSDLSFFDVCLNHVYAGASNEALTRAARALAAQFDEARTAAGRSFAHVAGRAASTTALQAGQGSVVGAEQVLDRVVLPLLRADKSVLLVLLDGMSVPASNDIVSDLLQGKHGAWKIGYPASEELTTAIAVYPTLTKYSRSSLLSGALGEGNQYTEKNAFTAWFKGSGVAAGAIERLEAKLFHKDELAAHLDSSVRAAILDTHRTKLVGAVLNTIDDALDKSQTLGRVWTVKDVEYLASLIDIASKVGRTVVLVSDHGHVVERHLSDISGVVPGESGVISARWREAVGEPEVGEVEVAGNRVLAPGGRAILAVDRDLRNTRKRAGYHGGLSLEEAVIPVTVLTQDAELPGYDLSTSLFAPPWWDAQPSAAAHPATHGSQPAGGSGSTKVSPNAGQLSLGFEAGPAWAELLHKNDEFQRRLQATPTFGQMEIDPVQILVAIDNNNGAIQENTLRTLLKLSPMLTRGVVSNLQKLVNMDGVQVVGTNGQDVTFNRLLLVDQFGLKG